MPHGSPPSQMWKELWRKILGTAQCQGGVLRAPTLQLLSCLPWKHDLPRHVRKYNTKRYYVYIKGRCKKTFFLEISPKCGWVRLLIPKQGPNPSNPPPPNYPENCLFRPKFQLLFSQISQKPWGGLVGKQIWERSPKKTFFLDAFPKLEIPVRIKGLSNIPYLFYTRNNTMSCFFCQCWNIEQNHSCKKGPLPHVHIQLFFFWLDNVVRKKE